MTIAEMASAGSWSTIVPPLHASIISTLGESFQFKNMTPVQSAAIPPILSHKDVCVQAETGSGKTLSFLIPLAQLMLFSARKRTRATPAVFGIILVPTRELARQVHQVACDFFKDLPGSVKPIPLIGGDSADAAPDAKYAGDHRVIIATPGRLAAAMTARSINCSRLEVFIMDEADRLLEMGFSVSIADVLSRLPKQRRTGIYSATQTKELDDLVRLGLRNPIRVVIRVRSRDTNDENDVKRQLIPASLSCYYATIPHRDRLAHLMTLLSENNTTKFIVYFMTCATVDFIRRLSLSQMLSNICKEQKKSDAVADDNQIERKFYALHGKLSVTQRTKALANFTQSDNGVLLCTDVAARGIDIPDVDWVVQYEPPQDPDAYIHRVGRTARLGRKGQAIIYLAPYETEYVSFLEVRKCPVVEFSLPSVEEFSKTKSAVRNHVQNETLSDRAVVEASESAFLSFIRAYKEHKCRYLFRLEKIDINDVADSFNLLRFPRFHEFKKLRKNMEPRSIGSIVIRDIAFKDKAREKRRQHLIKTAIENRSNDKTSKWKTKKRKLQEEDLLQNAKDKSKPTKLEEKRNAIAEEDGDSEIDDFSYEAMQLRKVKRGKLSKFAFDKLIGYEDENV